MARPLRIQFPGAIYHITCRGNERREIFYEDEDKRIFLDVLKKSLEIYNVNLFAYVLMKNHFHFLLKTPKGNLSEFMRHFNISYTANFNRRHNRVGHLFQGRYKSFLIEEESYLLEVSRYLHLNPVRIKEIKGKSFKEKMKYLTQYKGSSLAGYIGLKGRKEFINYGFLLSQYGGDNGKGRKAYRDFMEEGLREKIESPFKEAVGQVILGRKEFIERIIEKYLKNEKGEREKPSLKELRKVLSVEDIIEKTLEITGRKKEEFFSKGKVVKERAILMEMLYRYGRINQMEIGKMMGLDYSTVSVTRKRLRESMEKDKELKKLFQKIESEFSKNSRIKI